MPTTLPIRLIDPRAAAEPNHLTAFIGQFAFIFGTALLLLFPPLLILLVSAASLGHGHISVESLLAVLQMVGTDP